jgi:hypothetical protein
MMFADNSTSTTFIVESAMSSVKSAVPARMSLGRIVEAMDQPKLKLSSPFARTKE